MFRPVLLAIALSGLLVASCATQVDSTGRAGRTVSTSRYLAKTEIDRVIDASRAEVVAGLRRIAEKLYRRNPSEWQRAGVAAGGGHAAFVRRPGHLSRFPEGRSEGAATLALGPNYHGDWPGVVAGLLGMTYAIFEGKDDFYVLDDLDPQKLYNCARNFEIAVWKLSSARNAHGEILLYSNELDRNNPNLS